MAYLAISYSQRMVNRGSLRSSHFNQLFRAFWCLDLKCALQVILRSKIVGYIPIHLHKTSVYPGKLGKYGKIDKVAKMGYLEILETFNCGI